MIRLFMTGYTTGIMQDDFVVTGKKGYRYGLGVRVLNDTAESKSPVGEFGWDGAAGAYVMIDPVNHISIFYAQHIVGFPKVYSEIHPVIRDLVYEALEKSGYKGKKEFRLNPEKYLCMFETHIEQGPILEEAGNDIGVVD